jgi:hypothetical protein
MALEAAGAVTTVLSVVEKANNVIVAIQTIKAQDEDHKKFMRCAQHAKPLQLSVTWYNEALGLTVIVVQIVFKFHTESLPPLATSIYIVYTLTCCTARP